MNLLSPDTVCRVCGKTFASQGNGIGRLCLGCLFTPVFADRDESPPPPAADEPTGRRTSANPDTGGARFAHYEIETQADGSPVELGRGAMGITFRASDTTLRCEVALKVVNPELAGEPRTRARFLREARAAAGLRHPHVASVLFFGERAEDRQPFYAMELVEGETLHARVRRGGGLPAATVLEIGAQVADALAAAEACGLAHRDLKPANLMLVAGERVNVKIIDFGLAKSMTEEYSEGLELTRAGDFVGTPAFASPEHFNVWQETDARSDFYALGATLWYALTGQAPFKGRTLAEIRDRQLQGTLPLEQVRAARVPAPLVDLLRALLSPDPAGRPQTARELARALAGCRERVAFPAAGTWRRGVQRAGVLAALALAAGLAVWADHRYQKQTEEPGATATPTLEKSIAVLPFDNLSEDKANAFFTDGVQDEILTALAKLNDLKVISRSSVLGYGDPAKRPPAREIGRALGVAYLLEGSVQRAGSRVHLSAQLIDATHDRHVWADTFDRESADVFALQSEVANTIAGKLHARLSGKEQAALDAPPTRDLAAYELYLHAKELSYDFNPNTSTPAPLLEAARLLDEATARDPDFYEAWTLLTSVGGHLLVINADPTPQARTAQVEKALANTRRLRPDAGETHLAAASFFYNVHDPERGRPEAVLARQLLPNNWRALYLTGITGMIDGRWAEALDALQKARVCNPRHLGTLNTLMMLHQDLRRYDDAARVADDAIAAGVSPDYFARAHAAITQKQTGNAAEMEAVLQRLAGQNDPSQRNTLVEIDTALRERNYDQAEHVLAADARPEFVYRLHGIVPRTYLLGRIAQGRGNPDLARKEFELARQTYAEGVRIRPDEAEAWDTLADVDARLDRKEDALRESRHAVALAPISRDGKEGPPHLLNLAGICVLTGDPARALSILESLVNVPGALDYGDLAKCPDFDRLHGQGRFETVLQAVRQPVDLSKFNPADFPPPPEGPTPKP